MICERKRERNRVAVCDCRLCEREKERDRVVGCLCMLCERKRQIEGQSVWVCV